MTKLFGIHQFNWNHPCCSIITTIIIIEYEDFFCKTISNLMLHLRDWIGLAKLLLLWSFCFSTTLIHHTYWSIPHTDLTMCVKLSPFKSTFRLGTFHAVKIGIHKYINNFWIIIYRQSSTWHLLSLSRQARFLCSQFLWIMVGSSLPTEPWCRWILRRSAMWGTFT